MPMKRIRLELARDPEFPEGRRDMGYEFAAPLDDRGRLIPAEWRRARALCRVKSFRPDGAAEIGALVWRAGTWAFSYDIADAGAADAGFRLGTHRFISGEYVAFSEANGVKRTFRVARVADIE